MHVLLRGAQSGTSRRCRRGRYNSGIGPSSALRCTTLDHRSRRTASFSTLLDKIFGPALRSKKESAQAVRGGDHDADEPFAR
jgi:hypothetical protein